MMKKLKELNCLRTFLHSFSQVIFLENTMSGIFILAGIAVFSYEIGNLNPIILSIIAAIIGNLTAAAIDADKKAIVSGLFGYNPVLVAIASTTFFTGTSVYIVTILGSIIVTPITIMVNNICANLKLPGLTMPFIIITWLFILVGFQSNLLSLDSGRYGILASTKIFQDGKILWIESITKGMGEIYLLDTVYGSLLIFFAVAICKWRVALNIILVILSTIAIGFVFKVDISLLNLGLYTYNSILVYMGLEIFSINKNQAKYFKFSMLVILGVILVCLTDYATRVVLGVFGLPTLTFPFVLITWTVLYLEKILNN